MDTATIEKRIEAAKILAQQMPREIREQFEQHLQRKLDSLTERGRAVRLAEME